MADNINLDMAVRPGEMALANMDEALDRTADNIGQADYLPNGLRDGLMAMIAAGKANIDGVKLMNQEIAGYAETSIDANLKAARAAMMATSIEEAVAIQREHLHAAMNDGMKECGKMAELALTASKNAASPLRAQMESPWAAWFKAAA